MNPDKYIRKYFYDTLNNMVVNGKTIPIYDFRIPNDGNAYVLMTSASKDEDLSYKCGMIWECRLLLDIVTIYPSSANTGSRLLADDIQEKIIQLTQNISVNNFEVVKVERSYPDDLNLTTETQNIFRKFIRFNIKLK